MQLALRPIVAAVKSHRANSGHSRAPFPIEVWQKLAQSALTYGTDEVAKYAKVDRRTLASHVSAMKSGQSDFVECFVTSDETGAVTTVEVESKLGERMRIHCPHLTGSDLVALMKEFLDR